MNNTTGGQERPTGTELEATARNNAAESIRRLIAMADTWGDRDKTGPLAGRWAAALPRLQAALADLTADPGTAWDLARQAAEAEAGGVRRTVGDVERRRPDSGIKDTEAQDRAAMLADLATAARRAETWAAFATEAGRGLDVRGWTACRAALDLARQALEARRAGDKPEPSADGYKANFATLLKAVKAGDVALLSARRQADGGRAALVCAVNRPDGPGGAFELVPVAAMIDGDPYQIYEDPTAGTGGAGYGTGKDQHKPGPEAGA